MLAELGYLSLLLATGLALLQGTLPWLGLRLASRPLLGCAKPLALLVALLLVAALLLLASCFGQDDFTLVYVAQHANSALPLGFKLAAVWGGHEGSMLFFVFALGLWGALVALCSKRVDPLITTRVLAIMGLIVGLFGLYTLIFSSPFDRQFPGPLEGRDLNPMLQDIGLIIHPPLLYLGYVGFAVNFAFAMAALHSGRLDGAVAHWSRPWALGSWVFLTAGIVLGSWWAYYELGWGGWWFWDPVENSSFMPWLTGTALMHSLAVTEKRGCFKIWTVLLAIITFSLSLLGTFLVRSGVLTSVHAFATDPERGVFILAFLIIVIGLSFLLFAWRAPTVGLGGNFSMVSRESMLLVNNVLLVVAMGAVLLGTLYPLFLDALNAGKISVGPPYFDSVFGPIMLPMLFLLGVAPFARWKEADPLTLTKKLWWCFAAAIVIAAVVPFLMGRWSHWVFIGVTLAVWVAITVVYNIIDRGRNMQGSFFAKLFRHPRAFWGMQLAHLGVAVFVIGVALVKGYPAERDVRMYVGEQVTVAGYSFVFNGTKEVRGQNYTAVRGDFTVTREGKEITRLYPEKRNYFSSRSMPMTEAAIRHSITGDIYVSLGEPTPDGGWIVRAYSKPFVTWIWWGTIIMALGGLLAMTDRRYRLRRREDKGADAAVKEA